MPDCKRKLAEPLRCEGQTVIVGEDLEQQQAREASQDGCQC